MSPSSLASRPPTNAEDEELTTDGWNRSAKIQALGSVGPGGNVGDGCDDADWEVSDCTAGRWNVVLGDTVGGEAAATTEAEGPR